MAKIILLGKRGSVTEIIQVADDSKGVNEITKLRKKIAADGKYKDFSSIEIWNAQNGRAFSLSLIEKKAKFTVIKKELDTNRTLLDRAMEEVGEDSFSDYKDLVSKETEELEKIISERVSKVKAESEKANKTANKSAPSKPSSNVSPKK